MTRKKRTLLPIGIHMNLNHVHLAQLEQEEAALHVVSKASQVFRPASEELHSGGRAPDRNELASLLDRRFGQARSFIRQKISSNGFRGKEAVISLPGEYLVIQHVRLAPVQPNELNSALPYELQDKLPFDPRAAVIRHIVVGTVSENGETKQDVIALAARRDVVEKYITAMEKLGLQVVGVGVEPCAMCHPYAFETLHTPRDQEGPVSQMLLLMGGWVTHVAILRGAETMFVKNVQWGSEHLASALAKAGDTSLAEARQMRARWREADENTRAALTEEAIQQYQGVRSALETFAGEVLSCMRYHASLSRGASVNRVVFLGPEARDGALVKVLGAHLNTPCEAGDPGAIAGDSAGDPDLGVAMGLSLFSAE